MLRKIESYILEGQNLATNTDNKEKIELKYARDIKLSAKVQRETYEQEIESLFKKQISCLSNKTYD